MSQTQSALQVIAQEIYDQIKLTMTEVKASSSELLTVTLVLTNVIKVVQSYRIKTSSMSLTSSEKETVAIIAGRLLIADLQGGNSPILIVYDEVAPALIKGIVGVGKFFKEDIEKCSIFNCCRK